MSELEVFLSETLESNEFGPLLDWLEEEGCVNLRVRIESMLLRGETQWLTSVYFLELSPETLETLETRAQQANRLLGVAVP